MSTKPDPITAWTCTGCGNLTGADGLCDERVYECGQCGERGEERRCDSCNRFSARVTEPCCADCYADCEETEAVIDHDGELIAFDEWDPHTSLAARQAERDAAAEAAQMARAAQRKATQDAATAPITWGDVTVGDLVIWPDANADISPWDRDPRPHLVIGMQRRSDGKVQAQLFAGSQSIAVREAAAPAGRFTGQLRDYDREQFSAPVEPGVVLQQHEEYDWPSAPSSAARVIAGTWGELGKDIARVGVELFDPRGGMLHVPFLWVSRTQLEGDCLVLAQAASVLAAQQGKTLPEGMTVDVEEREYIMHRPTYRVTTTVAPEEFHGGVVAFCAREYGNRNSHNSSIADPALLLAVCNTLRTVADQLPA